MGSADPTLAVPDRLEAVPSDKGAAAKFAAHLLASMSREQAVDHLVDAIESRRNAFQVALAVEVLKLDGTDRLKSTLERCAVSPLIPDFSRVVQEVLCSGAPPDPDFARGLLSASDAAIDLTAAFSIESRFREFGHQEEAHLKVEDFLSSPIFQIDQGLSQAIDALTFVDDKAKQEVLLAEQRSSYQTYALKHGTLHVNDIYSGMPAAYIGSYTYWDKLIYMFRGEKDQFLVSGGSKGEIWGLYLPAEDLFLHFMRVPPIAARVWNTVKAHLAKSLLALGDTQRTELPQQAEIVVRIGGTENFAHHLWNYFGGLEKAKLLGLLPQIRALQLIGTEFFGPITDIYPELSPGGTSSREQTAIVGISSRGQIAVDASDIRNPARMVIPLGTHLLLPGVMNRVASLAEKTLADSAIDATAQKVKSFRRRIYVSLRVGDKAWIDADRELPKLINHALALYPDTCFIIDGFSSPVGVDNISQRWRRQIDELNAIVARILAQTEKPEQVFNIMGLNLLQSIALLRLSTFYITAAGTAHHKIDWLTNIGGILYLSPDYKDKPIRRVPGMAQRLNSTPPAVIFGEMTDRNSVRLQSSNDVRPNLSNFTCPWETIWMALAPHFESSERKVTATSRQAHTGINYLQFIGKLHSVFKPKSYFEIGTAKGKSLQLAQCDAVAVDPQFQFDAGCAGTRRRTILIQQTSDEFFRDDSLRNYFRSGVDFAFLDGMHLFEFLLRDLMHVSRFLRPNSIVVMHDCLPLTEHMALREQKKSDSTEPMANWWTGDVWKIIYVVKKYMPKVAMTCFDCPPTGLIALTNAKGVGAELEDRYFEIVAEFMNMDVQPGWLDKLYSDVEVFSSREYMAPKELRKLFWL